ncbi:MAG: nicotinate-nucleotide--dimethylbenzimidazole phosphoribosyltransferase [Aestuariivirga sp.]|nr:nicotinate-nucleotide--dimethylbenzimidazole phosphoribosyltransferase [Aestuariivirga sp.]
MSQDFDTIARILADLPGPDEVARLAAFERDRILTKPPGSLGRLEEIAAWVAAWQGRGSPRISKPAVCIFAGNHGVTRQEVSPYPSEVTAQMVANFAAGGAAINQLCGVHGIELAVHGLELDAPTGDITEGSALSEPECVSAIEAGMAAVPEGCDLLGLGEMGIGNTTIAAVIYASLFGGAPGHFVGRGTGASDAMLQRKADVVRLAIALHRPYLDDPLELLRRVGGREIAALFGALLAARIKHIPVVLDGYVVTSAAAVLHRANPIGLQHCIAGHVSSEGAHADVLHRLGLKPLLSLGLRLGEASGAALAMGIVMAAVRCHSGMASFTEAGVTDGEPTTADNTPSGGPENIVPLVVEARAR